MAAYLFVQIKITRMDGWPEYRAAVGPSAAAYGGKYLAIAPKVDVLEGSHDGRRTVIFEFPSVAAIHDWWNSPEYADIKKLREGSGELDVWAIPGLEA